MKHLATGTSPVHAASSRIPFDTYYFWVILSQWPARVDGSLMSIEQLRAIGRFARLSTLWNGETLLMPWH